MSTNETRKLETEPEFMDTELEDRIAAKIEADSAAGDDIARAADEDAEDQYAGL